MAFLVNGNGLVALNHNSSTKRGNQMGNINLRKTHSMSKEAAKSKAENIVSDLQGKFGFTYKWDGDTIRFKSDAGMAKGVSGTLTITNSDVQVDVDLPASLTLMKGFVEKQMQEKLNQALS